MGTAADVLRMENKRNGKEMTLADHAEAWWQEQGKSSPPPGHEGGAKCTSGG